MITLLFFATIFNSLATGFGYIEKLLAKKESALATAVVVTLKSSTPKPNWSSETQLIEK